jgi:hypothetical protein
MSSSSIALLGLTVFLVGQTTACTFVPPTQSKATNSELIQVSSTELVQKGISKTQQGDYKAASNSIRIMRMLTLTEVLHTAKLEKLKRRSPILLKH